MYLENAGDWGRFSSKPLVLLEDSLGMNVSAPHGEVQFQLTDMESQPVEGFTFEDCLPMALSDSVHAELHWKTLLVESCVWKCVCVTQNYLQSAATCTSSMPRTSG